MSRPIEMLTLEQHLDSQFSGLIRGLGRDAAEARKNFLSKALAAFFLTVEAAATPQDAVDASIDGGQDHGVDSVYISPTNVIWLVQSKYIEAGVGEPGLAECNSFADGVRAFLNQRFDEFNAQLQARVPQIRAAMDQGGARFRFALVYSGGALNQDRLDLFASLERAFNREQPDCLRFTRYGLTSLHNALIDLQEPGIGEQRIQLRDFGWITEPYRAVYGRMAAKDLANLSRQCAEQLVARNIRRFRGATQVNQGITQTLQREPAHLFYFNNGVTFLCSSLDQVGKRDETRSQGEFRFSDLSIVNGAQTAGTVASEPPAHYDAHPAEVLATFISLEAAGDEFGDKVTQYRNFQNAVQAQDFSALDEDQYRLRATLAMHGISYIYKPGQGDPEIGPLVFDVREAAQALACRIAGPDWPSLVVAAKKKIDSLFDRQPGVDANGAPLPCVMRRVFPDSLTALELWRAVQVVRFVALTLPAYASNDLERNILESASWLCSHIILLKSKMHEGVELALLADEQSVLSRWVEQVALQVLGLVTGQAWDKEVIELFNDETDCLQIRNRTLAGLPAAV